MQGYADHPAKNAHGEAFESFLVSGEVFGVHIARHLLIEGVYDTVAAQPILRGGGPADYFTIESNSKFKMYRPKAPPVDN